MSAAFVVVTGTDTGVGKTWVTAALARAATAAGLRVVAIKPIETGCTERDVAREDGVLLAAASGQAAPLRALLRFEAPLAPPEAAEREGRSIDYDHLLRQVREHAVGVDRALVEGAGGLLAPLTWQHTALELARDLGARVLVVGADRLGTINHLRLTVDHLTASRVEVLGVVLTPPAQPDTSTGSNAAAITRLTQVRVHHAPRTDDPDEAARSMKDVLRWLDPS